MKAKIPNKKEKNQAWKFCTFPMISNSDAGTFDVGFLCVTVTTYGWCAGLHGNGCCPSPFDNFGGSWLSMFEPRVSLMGWTIWCKWVLWHIPRRSWFVSNHMSLLPTGQDEIQLFDHSIFRSPPVSPRWSNMLLILVVVALHGYSGFGRSKFSPASNRLRQLSVVPRHHSGKLCS
jgi:hypothetical protein